MALNFGVIRERVTGKNMEGRRRGLILENIQEFLSCSLRHYPTLQSG